MAQGKIISEGPPETVMADPRVIDAYLGAHHDSDLGFAEEEQRLAAELEDGEKGDDGERAEDD
jgi:branched-chain amino acid transport system ATP-binding protein